MTKCRILILILSLSVFNSYGQNSNFNRISLRATTTVSGGEFLFDILSIEDSVKIIYSLKDSVSRKFEGDREVIETKRLLKEVKDFRPINDTVIRLTNKIDSLHQAFTSYSVDSLILSFNEVPAYAQLIDKILSSQVKNLENKNRVVLDGTSMRFIIINKGVSQTVYARSPSMESHPLLYRLIKETMNLYRDRRSNGFLTIQKTSGY